MHIEKIPLQKIYADIGIKPFEQLASLVGKPRYTNQYLPLANRYASMLQSVPLSKKGYAGIYGALKGGLEAGILAIRLCDTTMFDPKATAAQRMAHEHQYKFLVFSAVIATCYLISRQSITTCGQSGEMASWVIEPDAAEWPLMARWADDKKSVSITQSHVLLWQLMQPEWFAWIDPGLMEQWCASINPALEQSGGETPMGKVVRVAIETSMRHSNESLKKEIHEEGQADQGSYKAEGGQGESVEKVTPTASDSQARSESNEISQLSEASKAISEAQATEKPAQTARTSPPEKPMSPQQQMAREWLNALAVASLNPNDPLKLSEHITWDAEDKGVKLGRKALGFGTTPTKAADMLYEAGLIHERLENGLSLKREAALLLREALSKASKNTPAL